MWKKIKGRKSVEKIKFMKKWREKGFEREKEMI